MLKLKELIKEHTWDREFGDPLPTFEDVMKQHQVNKLEEGWWDNMSDAAKKAYIEKHGQAPNVAGDGGEPEDKPHGGDTGKDADYDMGEVPGSREEWEDIEPGDPEMRTGDESQEELGNMIKQQQNYIEDLYEKGADREDIEAAEGNREDMEREMEEKEDAEEKRGSEYSEDDPPPENKGDPDWEEFNLDAWGEKLDRAADDGRISGEDYKELEGTLEKIEDAYAKGDTETAEKLSAEYRRKTSGKFPWRGEESDDEEPDYSPGHPDNMDDDELKQFLDKDAEEDEGEPYKRKPFQAGDDPEELSLGAAQDELEKAKAELAKAEEEDLEVGYKKVLQKKIDALQGRIGRTGNELNQETLMIDGKQYRRISEGVKKQPKPKYEFSEFYKRFKR